ncbi:HCNGP-like protein-domain-containing protein [Chytridium lagenaria]|nr:HCNGP-like protein-domain-containing protein [Chytridium lagenaria]
MSGLVIDYASDSEEEEVPLELAPLPPQELVQIKPELPKDALPNLKRKSSDKSALEARKDEAKKLDAAGQSFEASSAVDEATAEQLITPSAYSRPMDTEMDLKSVLLSFIPTGIKLSHDVEGECDPKLQARIVKYTELRRQGTVFNNNLAKTHSFANPAIMSKLIEYLGLEEYGSNYDKSQFDPGGFPVEQYYDEIVKIQKRREQQAFQNIVGGSGPGMQFVSHAGGHLQGTTTQGGLNVQPTSSTADQSSQRKKRTRWDDKQQ